MPSDDVSLKLGIELDNDIQRGSNSLKGIIGQIAEIGELAKEKSKEAFDKMILIADGLEKKIPVMIKRGVMGISIAYGTLTATGLFLNDQFAQLGERFASIGDNSGSFFSDAIDASASARISIMTLKESVDELGRTGFKGSGEDLARFATKVHQFSTVTGIGKDSVAELISTLSKFGDVGEGVATGVLDGFSNIRKTYRMSTMESENLLKVTQDATESMLAFARTTSNDVGMAVTTSAMSLARFGGMMHEAGISTQTADNILRSMFTPSKWRENAFLMTQLGYSIGDLQRNLATGELPEAGDMFERLASTSRKFYDMSKNNPFLMEQYAKTLGMSVDEMARLGKMTDKEINTIKELKNAQQSLQQAWDDFGASTTQLRQVFAQLVTLGISLVTPAIQALNPIITKFADGLQWLIKSVNESVVIVPMLTSVFVALAGAISIISFASLVGNVQRGIATLSDLGSVVSVLTKVFGTLNMTILANPFAWIAVGVIALGVGLKVLYDRSEGFRKAIDNIANYVLPPFGGAMSILKALFIELSKEIKKTWSILSDALTPAFNALKIALTPVVDIMKPYIGMLIRMSFIISAIPFALVIGGIYAITMVLTGLVKTVGWLITAMTDGDKASTQLLDTLKQFITIPKWIEDGFKSIDISKLVLSGATGLPTHILTVMVNPIIDGFKLAFTTIQRMWDDFGKWIDSRTSELGAKFAKSLVKGVVSSFGVIPSFNMDKKTVVPPTPPSGETLKNTSTVSNMGLDTGTTAQIEATNNMVSKTVERIITQPPSAGIPDFADKLGVMVDEIRAQRLDMKAVFNRMLLNPSAVFQFGR
jgi:hypothetical protein